MRSHNPLTSHHLSQCRKPLRLAELCSLLSQPAPSPPVLAHNASPPPAALSQPPLAQLHAVALPAHLRCALSVRWRSRRADISPEYVLIITLVYNQACYFDREVKTNASHSHSHGKQDSSSSAPAPPSSSTSATKSLVWSVPASLKQQRVSDAQRLAVHSILSTKTERNSPNRTSSENTA